MMKPEQKSRVDLEQISGFCYWRAGLTPGRTCAPRPKDMPPAAYKNYLDLETPKEAPAIDPQLDKGQKWRAGVQLVVLLVQEFLVLLDSRHLSSVELTRSVNYHS